MTVTVCVGKWLTAQPLVSLVLCAQTQEALGQLSQSSKDALLKPIVEKPLSTEQFAQLEKINDAMTQEYSVRRKMLLKRADVTVQSFTWSGRMKVRSVLSATFTHSNSQWKKVPYCGS